MNLSFVGSDCIVLLSVTSKYVYTKGENDGYFGQEQVPLTDEIKDILYNYSDEQIFKVRFTF